MTGRVGARQKKPSTSTNISKLETKTKKPPPDAGVSDWGRFVQLKGSGRLSPAVSLTLFSILFLTDEEKVNLALVDIHVGNLDLNLVAWAV